jgi:hypothetical protein
VAKAGKFEVHPWGGGYPVWCDVMYNNVSIARIHHNELSDLRYVVEKAMQEARLILKGDRDEV